MMCIIHVRKTLNPLIISFTSKAVHGIINTVSTFRGTGFDALALRITFCTAFITEETSIINFALICSIRAYFIEAINAK